MPNPIYVIGHVNPDTDSIAAAFGYAWLLHERDGTDTVAARAGALNPQSTWLLKLLDMEPPVLIADASPRFQTVTRRLDTATPDSPLRDAWAITNRTSGIAPIVEEDGSPYGMIDGNSMFNFINKLVGPFPDRQNMKITDILDLACREAADTNVPCFQAGNRIRDVIHRILREEHNDFIVVDEKGLYLGVCSQRDVLNPPRLRVILVDHNEPGQALGALEEAELIEILDHHRLGNHSTHIPIRFTVDIVGSTSTLIYERIEDAGLSAPPQIAALLMAGLLSDTLVLTSPTTTDRDRRASERLSRWAFIRSGYLGGETIESFGQKILRAGSGLSTRDPKDIVSTDLKLYESGGFKFAIAQVEVTDLLQLKEHLNPLRLALDDLRERRGQDFALLMVTDIVGGSSKVILVNAPAILDDLPYPRQTDGTLDAEGVVSRKKQLLPAILGLLES
jgi:manganese-dependent inorganic pyrophosphatase